MYTILKTSRNKDSILFRKHRYYLKTVNKDGSKYWVCNQVNCKATVTTYESRVIKINATKWPIEEEVNDEDDEEQVVRRSHAQSPAHAMSERAMQAELAKHNLRTRVRHFNEGLVHAFRDEKAKLIERLGCVDTECVDALNSTRRSLSKNLFRKYTFVPANRQTKYRTM